MQVGFSGSRLLGRDSHIENLLAVFSGSITIGEENIGFVREVGMWISLNKVLNLFHGELWSRDKSSNLFCYAATLVIGYKLSLEKKPWPWIELAISNKGIFQRGLKAEG